MRLNLLRASLLFLLAFSWYNGTSQCLTDLRKVLPKRLSPKDFRSSQVTTGGDFLVVANPQDDTTGYISNGAAYVYERSAAGWNYKALLKPSNVSNQQSFGYRVGMDSLGESVAVIAFGWLPGSSEVYIYQKPSSGWTDAYEFDRIKLSDTLTNVTVAKFSPDGLTLVVGQSQELEYGAGLVYIFKRNNLSEKFSDKIPAILTPPANYHSYGADVAVDQNYIAASAEYVYDMGLGAIFIYKNDLQSNYPLVATLKDSTTGTFGQSFKMKNNLIVARGLSSKAYGPVICVFEKKQESNWSDTFSSQLLPMPDWNTDLEIVDSLTIAFGTDPVVNYSGFTFTSQKEIVGTVTKLGSSWRTFQVDTIYQEALPKGGSVSREFRNNLNSISWNGSELIVVPTLDASGSNFTNAITSITRSNGIWGSVIKIRFPNKNSYSNLFGYALIKAGGNLIVSSPQDSEVAPSLGSVRILTKDLNQNWIETNSIQAPSQDGIDRHFFANSLSASDSILAIGAINSGVNYSGEVFLYKRTGSDWNSFSFYQSITPSSNISYSFGSSLGISSKVLAVSGFSTTLGGGTNNAMDIFELGPSGYHFVKTIDFGNAWSHGQNSKIFVRNDSIFAFSGVGGYGGSATGVFIIAKDAITHDWSFISSFDLSDQDMASASIFDFREITLEVNGDHVFIGIPGLPLGDVLDVGRVFVYTKLPGTKWPTGSIHHSSVIYPKDTVEFGYFGYSIANSENTLVIGAPGTDNKLVSMYPYQWAPRNQPGAAYVFSTQDYYWTSTTQLLKLQGTEYNKPFTDHMGLAVASDYDFYFSGAPNENNDHGAQAGAVYTIPTPPLVKLMAPVCKNSGPMKLFGYPFGGTWSGPGLVQGSNGTFDPNLVGPGKFLLTYQTPNCTYDGKLLIEVLKNPVATLSSPTSLIICPTNPQTIGINPLDSATYQWYFQSPNGSLTQLSGKTSVSVSVNLAGSYYCVVTKGQCSAQSPAVTVTYETPSASIGPQKVICDSNKTINLTASPSGGTWSGGNVTDPTNGIFNPSGLTNGKYPIKYTFTSQLGCSYSFADTVLVDTIPKVQLTRLPGDFCISGLVNLQVSPAARGAKFLWNYKSAPSSAWTRIDSVSNPSRTFVARGYYECLVSNRYCKAKTDSLLVGDLNDINLTLNPLDSLITVCLDRTTELNASSTRADVTFSWYQLDTIQNNYQVISSGQSVMVDHSGYYKVKAVIGFCESESTLKKVKFLPKDTLFVPNVFTPDGDGFNPDFSIASNSNNYSIEILNRWGDVVYTGDKNSRPWDGGNHPTGVYFWSVEYRDCGNNEKKAKGWVQIIR